MIFQYFMYLCTHEKERKETKTIIFNQYTKK